MTRAGWVVTLPMYLRSQLTDAARGLTDQQYVLGMLRAVISCSRSEDTTLLEQWVVGWECGSDLYDYAPQSSTRLVEIRHLADVIALQECCTSKDFEWFSKLCAAQLRANGAEWVATVNRLGEDTQ